MYKDHREKAAKTDTLSKDVFFAALHSWTKEEEKKEEQKIILAHSLKLFLTLCIEAEHRERNPQNVFEAAHIEKETYTITSMCPRAMPLP